ncbi:MAG: hypothetical protein MJ146_02105 [Clostridia bacterium]|nr:hypothetical protein [Clostridia bacterium]
MKDLWKDVSIGQIMRDEKISKAILEIVKEDEFLTRYFTTFGKNAKHSFSEIEDGFAVDKETLERIRECLNSV